NYQSGAHNKKVKAKVHTFQKRFLEQPSDSDKLSHHGYHRIYPWFLEHFRDREVDLLEIGIEQTESLKLWKGYFKEVRLKGLDIDEKFFEDGDVKLYKVDQSQVDELRQFRKGVGVEFDIIIDDGSHVPSHQILTLNELWDVLRPGGVYIIEDIETSYWKNSSIYGYRFDSRKENAIRYASQLIDKINSEFVGGDMRHDETASAVMDEVEIVAFAHNCIVLVKKDTLSFGNYYKRNYRFSYRINMHSFWAKVFRKLQKLTRSRV
ncbi:class I SAM-dependent methyltransferase, partial [bacterium]|nr:class I SAM-dependent methyltransferase [bacterium]